MNLYKRLLSYLKPYRGKFAVAAICMIFVSASAGAAALIIQPILDDIFISKDENMLALLPVGVVVIYLVRGVGRYFASSIMQVIGQFAVRDIRDGLFTHLQRLSPRFYMSRQTGKLISRITNDVQVIQDAVSIVVYDLLRESLTMIALLGVIFYRDWKLASLSILVIPFSAALIGRLGKSLRVISKESQERMADLTALLYETFTGIRVVQAFGMEKYEVDRFKEANMRYFDTIKRTIRVNELSSPLLEFIGAFGIAAIIWYGGSQVIAGHTTVGAFFSFLTALFMLYAPISKLSRSNNKIQQAMAAAKRIFDLIDTEPEIEDKPDAVKLTPLNRSIEFRNVSFEYEPGTKVLDNISLEIKKGSTAAFVGTSGSGKTTLVNLIPRFFDVTQGAILYDGVDLRDASVSSLRKHIGIVTQEIFLFHDTIAGNILYGSPSGSFGDVQKAAKGAYADKFIMELPDKYETMIGERGVKLSGGERQRISIARAIMKDPAILILDEATSALDTQSEKMVQKAILNLMTGRTTFVIAHRLSTILNADTIVVIDKGEIVEMGGHKELLGKKGYYHRLFTMQFDDGSAIESDE